MTRTDGNGFGSQIATDTSRGRATTEGIENMGGDRRSGRIEAHHDAVLAALGPAKDATVEEVGLALSQQGLTFGFGSIKRFFALYIRTDVSRDAEVADWDLQVPPPHRNIGGMSIKRKSP